MESPKGFRHRNAKELVETIEAGPGKTITGFYAALVRQILTGALSKPYPFHVKLSPTLRQMILRPFGRQWE